MPLSEGPGPGPGLPSRGLTPVAVTSWHGASVTRRTVAPPAGTVVTPTGTVTVLEVGPYRVLFNSIYGQYPSEWMIAGP